MEVDEWIHIIVEPWNAPPDIFNFFVNEKIPFRSRSMQLTEDNKISTRMIYETFITDEDALFIKLTYPYAQITKKKYR